MKTSKQFENFYDSTPILYCTVDAKGIILDCNAACANNLGWNKAELHGNSIFDHVASESSLGTMRDILARWNEDGSVPNKEMWFKRRKGSIFPVLVSATSLRDPSEGALACSLAIIDESDIYKTRKDFEDANQELRRREELKNEFVAIASHELRTPIQPILGFAILAKKGKISQEEAWDGVLKEARRLQQLANDILDVSRIESGSLTYTMERVKISDLMVNVIDSARANLSKNTSLDLSMDEATRDLEVDVDKSRITQVLTNLVGNAVKFTEQGSVVMSSRLFPTDSNKIEIRISDTGKGIPENIFPYLFGKFVTRNVGESNTHGTGLGLFISKAIITAHKGEISASNNEHGSGASFVIALPIKQ